MRDLDSYDVFCALKLLESREQKTSLSNNKTDEEIICSCAKYLQQLTTN
ncbi:MAG: hypothetical protein K0R98_951 [Rickettsiaceae bacterium]|jgi:hypothetical protein|nr:hypothetical protein [Rickettsiaceae bacterium]